MFNLSLDEFKKELDRKEDELLKSINYLLVSPKMMKVIREMNLDPGFNIYFVDTLAYNKIDLTNKQGFDWLFNLYDYTKQTTFDNPNEVVFSINKEDD